MAYFQKGTTPAPDPHIWDALLVVKEGLGGGMLAIGELDATKNSGYLLKGCPLYLDYADKAAHIVKSGLVITGGTTTLPRVNKNHLFKVGDIVYVSGDAVTINAIDTSNSAYDVFTLSAACTGAAAGAYLELATAAGATPAKKYVPNCLLGDTTKIVTGATVPCIFRANQWLQRNLFPHAISDVSIASLAPNIIIKG
jgi:hypothetical protein